MQPNPQWRPPPVAVPRNPRPWLPAAILGAAIVVAAGLIAGALILRKGDSGPTTCESWTDTQSTLEAIPALPNGWNFQTPGIDMFIQNQNAPVDKTLEIFEGKIRAKPADVAQAAHDYVTVRRKQSAALTDHSYTPEVGDDVNAALQHLNEVCGISAG